MQSLKHNRKLRDVNIGVARGGQRGYSPPKFLENTAIVFFERRFSKQNSVIRLKSSILHPPNFFGPSQICGLATPLEVNEDSDKCKFLNYLKHTSQITAESRVLTYDLLCRTLCEWIKSFSPKKGKFMRVTPQGGSPNRGVPRQVLRSPPLKYTTDHAINNKHGDNYGLHELCPLPIQVKKLLCYYVRSVQINFNNLLLLDYS